MTLHTIYSFAYAHHIQNYSSETCDRPNTYYLQKLITVGI